MLVSDLERLFNRTLICLDMRLERRRSTSISLLSLPYLADAALSLRMREKFAKIQSLKTQKLERCPKLLGSSYFGMSRYVQA